MDNEFIFSIYNIHIANGSRLLILKKTICKLIVIFKKCIEESMPSSC
jgi:hypothetical protein